MTVNESVFLDANAIIYALDKTSDYNNQAAAIIDRFLTGSTVICTSHHVIEEVLHVARKLAGKVYTLSEVIEEIDGMPGLLLVEPATNLDFARRYARLADRLDAGINDALILQLILDAEIDKLFTYDTALQAKARKLGIGVAA